MILLCPGQRHCQQRHRSAGFFLVAPHAMHTAMHTVTASHTMTPLLSGRQHWRRRQRQPWSVLSPLRRPSGTLSRRRTANLAAPRDTPAAAGLRT